MIVGHEPTVSISAQWLASADSDGEQRTLRKLMQSNERKVETLNGKIEDVRASMAAADPTDFTALGDFQAQISDLQQQIDALEEEWMEAAEKLPFLPEIFRSVASM